MIVSIPNGTIKRVSEKHLFADRILFQFQMVRLKGGVFPEQLKENQKFQFQMVRLKAAWGRLHNQ